MHAEITEFDPPVRSPVSSVAAFYDPETSILHIRAADGEAVDWPAAFRALFVQVESDSSSIDIPALVMTAAYVASLATRSEAEQALRNSGYRPPEEAGDDLPLGEELGDAPDDPIDDGTLDSHAFDNAGQTEQGSTGEDDYEEGSGDDDLASADSGDESDDVKDDGVVGMEGEPKGDIDAPFKSSSGTGAFGADPKESSAKKGAGSSGAGRDGSGGRAGDPSGGGGAQRQDTSRERQTRRSRMLTYVGTGDDRSDATRRVGDDDNISDLIDVAAITAVLKYEQKRGWLPEEQPHGNPGYDIISRSADGASRRLIEVKGLDGDWTERGIKLSHVQYGMAETNPEEFWIYVVENARDLQRQCVNAIANPFSKVEEYWFDDRWRQLSSEYASAEDINIIVGARVRHDLWGTGTIVDVKHHGRVPFVTVDFGRDEGRRGVFYPSGLKFVD